MSRNLQKRIVLNTVAATAGNRYNDTTLRHYFICADNSADPLVEYSNPIPYSSVTGVQNIPAAAEVVQHALIGEIEETIVANRFYSISVGNPTEDKEGWHTTPKNYSYTAATALSGSADTDRYNVYYALVTKVNADNYNYVTAYLVDRMPFDTGSAEPTYNEVITGGTSTETANIVAWEVTSGTWGGGTAAGNVWIYNASGDFTAAGENVTGATTAVFASTASQTDGQAMLIADDAGYSPARPATRGGASEVKVTEGFDASVVEVTQTAVYGVGDGTRMVQDKPYFTVDKLNVTTGEADFITNDDPVAGTYYTTFVVSIRPEANADSISDISGTSAYDLVIYAAQTSASVVGANVTALATALTNMMTNT